MNLLLSLSNKAQNGSVVQPVAVPSGIRPVAGQTVIRPVMPHLETDFVKNILDNQDRTPETSRVGKNGYVHVSSLIGGCTRKYVIARRFDVEMVEVVTGGHRVVWALGRAAEKHVKEQIIESRNHNGIWGVWKCKCGQHKHEGTYPANIPACHTCGTKLKVYYEPGLLDHENHIVGSPDVTLVLPGQYFLPVEVKSMTADQFNELKAPLADHVNQAAMYRYLYQINGKNVHDKVSIIYVSKGFKWGSPYKEYQVDCTQRPIELMVEESIQIARTIKQNTLAKTLPPRTVCTSMESTPAKSCSVCNLCFSME